MPVFEKEPEFHHPDCKILRMDFGDQNESAIFDGRFSLSFWVHRIVDAKPLTGCMLEIKKV